MQSDRKRKISEVESAEEKAEIKLMKMEDKEEALAIDEEIFDDENSDCSETSERYEDLSIHTVEEYLRPQEIALLKRDPFGANFRTSVWTNEFTMRRKNHQPSPWLNRDAVFTSDVLPPEVFVEILSWCDLVTTLTMRHVSMWMNRLIMEDQSMWRKVYYRRHWRLKHDIENNFVGTDPDSVDKSDWINVVPDNEVDWIEEYKRNHINSTLIRRLFEEIKSKLERLIDEVGVVKEGVTNPMIFEPGVSDEEIDDKILIDGLPITNDLRELLKCGNGARFWMIEPNTYLWYDRLPVNFPSLSKLSLGISQQKLYELEDDNSTDPSTYCGEFHEHDLTISTPRPPLKFRQSDMRSDGNDYVPSIFDLNDQEECSVDSVDEDDPWNSNSPINQLIFFNINEMDRLPGWTSEHQVAYNPLTGSIDQIDVSYYADRTVYYLDGSTDSIVSYLQMVSEHLDFPQSISWLRCQDYEISEIEDDVVLIGAGHCNNVTEVFWHWLIRQTMKDVAGSSSRASPRAEKLLYTACQEMMAKIFAKAQQIESTDTLQPDSLIAAANEIEVGLDFQRVSNPVDPKNRENDNYYRVTKEAYEDVQKRRIDL